MGIAKNFAYKSLLNFFSMVIPVIIMPYLYRRLSPSSIGIYEYAYSIMTYFSILGVMGIYNYGIREISKIRDCHEDANGLFNDLFFAGLFSNLFAVTLYIMFCVFFISDETLRNIMLILSCMIIGNAFNIEWCNEAYEQFKFITTKTICIRLLSLVLIFSFIRSNSDLYIYVWITTLTLLANYLVSFIYAKRRFSLSFRKSKILRHIVPLIIVLVLNNTAILYCNIDMTFLGLFSDDSSVAYFSVANKIMSTIYTCVMIMMYVSYPKLSYYNKNDFEEYKRLLSKMARITLAVVFPISVGLFMLSAPIIYLFSGKEYMPTSPVLKIFAIYMIVSAFLSILNHQVFFINGKERKSVYLFFLFGIVNTLAVWILGSSITPEYAILTTCVSQALLTVVMAIYARRNLGVFCELFNLQVVKYLVCSLIVVPIVLISCWIMDSYYLQLALSIPISIIAYSGILLMLKDDAILELIRKVPFIGHKGA